MTPNVGIKNSAPNVRTGLERRYIATPAQSGTAFTIRKGSPLGILLAITHASTSTGAIGEMPAVYGLSIQPNVRII